MAQRVLILVALLLAACDGPPPPGPEKVPVRVDRVILGTNLAPAVVLEETDGPRVLYIWIGLNEAHSIAAHLADQPASRPNTHDLAKRLIDGLDAEVTEIVVNDLRSGVYFAVLKLSRGGRTVEIDSRPSDAIAIALRTGSPIYVHAELFEDADVDGSERETDEPGQEVRWETRSALRRPAPRTSSPCDVPSIETGRPGATGVARL